VNQIEKELKMDGIDLLPKLKDCSNYSICIRWIHSNGLLAKHSFLIWPKPTSFVLLAKHSVLTWLELTFNRLIFSLKVPNIIKLTFRCVFAAYVHVNLDY
jgi:hypothetical protein